MDAQHKEQLLHTTKEHIADTTLAISEALVTTEQTLAKGSHEMWKLSYADQMVQHTLTMYNQKRLEELVSLLPSPYFVRCEVELEGKGKDVMYFAKFPFTEKSIYWWVAPAAAIRFENPGEFSFTKYDGTVQRGKLVRKDNFLIVDGKLVFFATESVSAPRELIFQEHFTTRKQGFVLPEIVAQMEKAQDQVVRIPYQGPFVITGPAGSGKTTLALHRIAFLAQSPETADKFRGSSVLVLVQDKGTQAYFSQVLPELGITDVHITTFGDWAKEILALGELVTIVTQYGEQVNADSYAWKKLSVVESGTVPVWGTSVWASLESVYTRYFSETELEIWRHQKKEKVLDRYDVTLLLSAYREKFGTLEKKETYIVPKKNGGLERKTKKFSMVYSLILVDEFQNYLPQQLKLIRSCINRESESMVYVGDKAQQIYIGTLREWEQIGEKIPEERQVVLQKVYRNTKEILHYIASLAYPVRIPEQVKSGAEVEEIVGNEEEQKRAVEKIIAENPEKLIAIIAQERKDLEIYEALRNEKHVHVMTMIASQGVEFDVVCVVGVHVNMFRVNKNFSPEQQAQLRTIHRDVLYVGLTRAREQLFVLGTTKLSELLK